MTPDLKGERRKIIFHLPFEIDRTRFSASQIRPLKMLEAFKKIGYDVFEVMGNTKNRKKSVEKLKESFSRGAVYEFCYSESSTMPTLLTDNNNLPNAPLLEVNFFSLLQKNKVPIGIFYRDIYWKFNFYRKSVGFLKSTFATFFIIWICGCIKSSPLPYFYPLFPWQNICRKILPTGQLLYLPDVR